MMVKPKNNFKTLKTYLGMVRVAGQGIPELLVGTPVLQDNHPLVADHRQPVGAGLRLLGSSLLGEGKHH